VGAFAFGLSVALVMLIFEDDLDVAAMPIVVSIAGVAMFVGARKHRARKRLEQLQEKNPRSTCGNRKQTGAPMVAGPRDIRARDT
jgi:hypothetical protein